MRDQSTTHPDITIAELETRFLAWHRQQYPDLTPEIAWAKLETEVAELKLAVLGWQWRRGQASEAAVLEEGADVLNTLLGVLRWVVGDGHSGAFAAAVAEKLERVERREYDGAASATRRKP